MQQAFLYYVCDHFEDGSPCDEQSPVCHDWRDARSDAKAAGWLLRSTTEHYCPKHAAGRQ